MFSSNCSYKPNLLAKVPNTIPPHFHLCPGLFTQATGGVPFVAWILTSRVSTSVSEPWDPRRVTHDCPQLNHAQVEAQQLVAQILSPQSLSLESESSTLFPFFSLPFMPPPHKYPSHYYYFPLKWVFKNPKLCVQTMQPSARLHEALDASLIHFFRR